MGEDLLPMFVLVVAPAAAWMLIAWLADSRRRPR